MQLYFVCHLHAHHIGHYMVMGNSPSPLGDIWEPTDVPGTVDNAITSQHPVDVSSRVKRPKELKEKPEKKDKKSKKDKKKKRRKERQAEEASVESSPDSSDGEGEQSSDAAAAPASVEEPSAKKAKVPPHPQTKKGQAAAMMASPDLAESSPTTSRATAGSGSQPPKAKRGGLAALKTRLGA
jgi:hypothetical protein